MKKYFEIHFCGVYNFRGGTYDGIMFSLVKKNYECVMPKHFHFANTLMMVNNLFFNVKYLLIELRHYPLLIIDTTLFLRNSLSNLDKVYTVIALSRNA